MIVPVEVVIEHEAHDCWRATVPEGFQFVGDTIPHLVERMLGSMTHFGGAVQKISMVVYMDDGKGDERGKAKVESIPDT